MTEYSKYQLLLDLYELLNITDGPTYKTERDELGNWIIEMDSDGKLLHTNIIGIGETENEALDDAVERFISVTPVIDNVPTTKLIKMMECEKKT